jgi:transcriptional regulator with XRE-family HTH domain
MPEPNPTVRQREIGMRLRQLRTGLGLTVEDVATRLLCSATKVSRLETGTRRASLRDVRDLCQIYQLDEPDTAEFMELAREARQAGWWTRFPDLNLTPYIGFEHEAIGITAFSMYSIPALLQTTSYAEALNSRAAGIDSAGQAKRIEALLRRQQILERDSPPRYRALLDEAVLHRQVGGRSVMAAQLNKILDLTHAGQVTVQVIPFDVGAHGAADSNFELFEFGKDTLPPIVFVEGLISNLYQERPAEIERYRLTADYLRDVSLNPRDSVKLMNSLGQTAQKRESQANRRMPPTQGLNHPD